MSAIWPGRGTKPDRLLVLLLALTDAEPEREPGTEEGSEGEAMISGARFIPPPPPPPWVCPDSAEAGRGSESDSEGLELRPGHAACGCCCCCAWRCDCDCDCDCDCSVAPVDLGDPSGLRMGLLPAPAAVAAAVAALEAESGSARELLRTSGGRVDEWPCAKVNCCCGWCASLELAPPPPLPLVPPAAA